jgi:hypothetical protein
MTIHIGIGGWTFAPWRGVFYPAGLPHAQELRYAAERLTSIEINGTFYRTQSPASFRKWEGEVPTPFVFALKGPRYATHRKPLAEAGPSIERFLASGPLTLGDKLGPMTSAHSSSCCRTSGTAGSCVTSSRRATRAFPTRASSSSCARTRSPTPSSSPTSTRWRKT